MLNPEFISPPVALTIAGSDCSGGAGIQADLKAFHQSRVHGLSAITCVVSETPGIVEKIHAIPPEILASQVELLLRQYPIAAIKTGMLFSTAHIDAILPSLQGRKLPLIVDPVMIATSGDALIEDSAIAAYRERICPMATLITPNLNETVALLNCPAISSLDEARDAAQTLSIKYSTAVLVKGGHLEGNYATDVFAVPHKAPVLIQSPFISKVTTHGTGCTLSAAITAAMANGMPLLDAVHHGKNVISKAILHSLRWPLQKDAGISAEMQALNLFQNARTGF